MITLACIQWIDNIADLPDIKFHVRLADKRITRSESNGSDHVPAEHIGISASARVSGVPDHTVGKPYIADRHASPPAGDILRMSVREHAQSSFYRPCRKMIYIVADFDPKR